VSDASVDDQVVCCHAEQLSGDRQDPSLQLACRERPRARAVAADRNLGR
jgi:hypothetical protein